MESVCPISTHPKVKRTTGVSVTMVTQDRYVIQGIGSKISTIAGTPETTNETNSFNP